MPPTGPPGRTAIFSKLKPSGVPASHRQILFLRGQTDHLQFRSLTPANRAALVALLDKCWTEFATAYRASLRNSEYAGLVAALLHPFHQEWCPRWIVHWHIDPKRDAELPYALEDYVLKVEKLQHLEQ